VSSGGRLVASVLVTSRIVACALSGTRPAFVQKPGSVGLLAPPVTRTTIFVGGTATV